eukprot:Awhi_evm1s324
MSMFFQVSPAEPIQNTNIKAKVQRTNTADLEAEHQQTCKSDKSDSHKYEEVHDDHSSHTKALSREVRIKKLKNEPFGITLCRISVDKLGVNRELSPAYRCGLIWGDYITTLNGTSTKNLSLNYIYDVLDEDTDITIRTGGNEIAEFQLGKEYCGNTRTKEIGMIADNDGIIDIAPSCEFSFIGMESGMTLISVN